MSVTVGIPVYNGAKTIARAIESVFAQNIDDLVIVVCDNASTDNTELVVRKCANGSDKLEFWHFDKHVSAGQNFNRCLSLAETEYFMWLAADDVLGPGTIFEMRLALKDSPEASFACPQIKLFGEDDSEGIFHQCENTRLMILASSEHQEQILGYLKILGLSGKASWIYSLCRTDKLKSIGGYTVIPNFKFATDVITVARLLCKGRAVPTRNATLFKSWAPSTEKRDHDDVIQFWTHARELLIPEVTDSKTRSEIESYIEKAEREVMNP